MDKRSTSILIGVAFVTAAACSSGYKWQAPGNLTDLESRKAWHECYGDAQSLYNQNRPTPMPLQGRSKTIMRDGASSAAWNASDSLFESCLLAHGFQKVPLQSVARRGPEWLNWQRVLKESQKGKHIKQELRNFIAVRQKPISDRKAELDTQTNKLIVLSQSETDEQDVNIYSSEAKEPDWAYRGQQAEYQAMVRAFRTEVQSKTDATLRAFLQEVEKAADEVSKRSALPDDPNAAVIEILDTRWQQSQP